MRPPGPNDHTVLHFPPPNQGSHGTQPLANPQSRLAGPENLQIESTPWPIPTVTYPVPVAIASKPNNLPCAETLPLPNSQLLARQAHGEIQGDRQILRIHLRQIGPSQLSSEDISLHPGDVVVVPSRRHEVFFVVGRLSTTNNIRFRLGDRDREIGVGFILPRDREIDVVTAVVMAGYIDPIDSPTTVTVHRTGPDGNPFLIHVDLIKARYDAKETVLVQAGDIIYLNPDSAWWWRRTFDRIVPDVFIQPYRSLLDVNRGR